MRNFTIALAFILFLGQASIAAASEPIGIEDVPLPSVAGPLPSTTESYPFNAASETRVPQNLAMHGYVEEEYFVRGDGRIYDFPAVGELNSLGAGEYVTRILIRRPADPTRFNGAVIVEPFNPSRMADIDLMWILSRDHFMREGIVWVGVTFKPVAVKALQRFAPERYRSLSFANPLTGDQRCPDLEIGEDADETEVGFSFDILSQIGTLLRSDSSKNPLREFDVTRAYLTGYSQTAGLARSYAIAIAPVAKRDGGKKIYDGYLYAGHAPFNVLFHNCDTLNPPGDPRLAVPSVGVPIFDIAVEGDVLASGNEARPDHDVSPDFFRRYEIAGATHSGSLFGPFTPREEDFDRAGIAPSSTGHCVPADPPLSPFPLDHVFNAAWQNFDSWVVDGVAPPPDERLRLAGVSEDTAPAGSLRAERDALGNALGGVRTVAVEAPVMRWHGQRGGDPRCTRLGYAEPLDPAALRKLYPTQSDYLRQVNEAADRLQTERWLTPHDAWAVKKAAWHENIGGEK